jgi:hypothetical protein
VTFALKSQGAEGTGTGWQQITDFVELWPVYLGLGQVWTSFRHHLSIPNLEGWIPGDEGCLRLEEAAQGSVEPCPHQQLTRDYSRL